jgi:hypothetical protein
LQAARPRLPSLFEQLRQVFERHGSLRMPYTDVITAILGMNLAPEGMSSHEASVHLALLERAAPDWLTIGSATVSLPDSTKGQQRCVTLSRMCTGVRQRLDDIAHGYAHV